VAGIAEEGVKAAVEEAAVAMEAGVRAA